MRTEPAPFASQVGNVNHQITPTLGLQPNAKSIGIELTVSSYFSVIIFTFFISIDRRFILKATQFDGVVL
jgi:hypothetical protein